MMKTFQSKLRKSFYTNGKLKEYQTSLGVNTQINDDRFHKNDKGKYVCNIVLAFPDEFEEFCNEHEFLQTENQALKESIDAQEKSIKKLEDKLSSIDERHEEKIKSLEDEYSERIGKLNDDLHERDLEIERTKTKYEEQIGNLKEEHQKEINGLKIFDEESHMSIIEHQKRISELKAKHQEEMDALEVFDEEKHMKITDYFKEISGIKDRISIETIHHNDNLNSLQNNLKLLPYIKGDYKSSFELLKEDIEQFRYIAQYIELKENEILPDVKKKEDDEDSS